VGLFCTPARLGSRFGRYFTETHKPAVERTVDSCTTQQWHYPHMLTDEQSSSAAAPAMMHAEHMLNTGAEDSKAQESVSETDSSTSSPDLYPFLTRFIHRADVSQSDIWLRDLELL
jgi:hypothetical protein